ncbi:MAG: SH3 domain-containing protein [Anaerolineae bacterium]
MSSQSFIVHINGNPNVPTIREVKVRPTPGTTQTELFKVPVPTQNCRVLEVQPDPQGTNLNGKVFQWFRVVLPDNREGWVRDDLVNLIGDGRLFGYPSLASSTYAFSLARSGNTNPTPASVAATTPASTTPAATTPVATTPTTTTAPAAAPAATTAPAAVTTPGVGGPTARPLGPVVPTPQVTPGTVLAVCIANRGANLRAAPVSGAIVAKVDYLAQLTVIGATAQGGNTNYYWVNVRTAAGQTGFIRNSFLKIVGDASQWGLSKGDEYPMPMQAYWWVRGFGINFPANDPNETYHDGWDLGAVTGEPMLAGPRGGVVTQTNVCQKCTPDKPNTPAWGISVGDTSVFSDPAWGFGYGNFVVVRYDNNLLPASTQQRLAQRNLAGAHVFVMFGHLANFTARNGQQLGGYEQFGQCGNTGNSEATHLHLEVRAGSNPNAQWSQLRPGLLEPGNLFSR